MKTAITNKKKSLLKLTKVLMAVAFMSLGLKANAQCFTNYTYVIDTMDNGYVTFNATSSGSPDPFYMWDFGDGNNSYGQNVNHTYLTGTYTACLVMVDSLGTPVCADTVCYTFAVINNTTPTGGCGAHFSVHDSLNTIGIFTDQSTGTGLTYSWNFGDGTISTVAGSAAHEYTTAGTYWICLTVSGSMGCTSTYCDSIQIANGLSGACLGIVDSHFSVLDSGSYGIFINTPSGPNQVYFWEFGDGATSTTTGTVSHMYTANGTYPVCLTVYDTSGVDSCQYCSSVTIDGILNCDASFTVIQDTMDTYSFFIYTNNASPSGTERYYWDFGDGFTSSLQYPSHTYSGTGPYYLCLGVADTIGIQTCFDMYCDSIVAGRSSTGITVTVVAPLSTGISEQVNDAVLENYPNPFSGSTTISYTISKDANVELNVIDLLGNKVAALDKSHKSAGSYTTVWNADGVAQGMYLLQMINNNQVTIKKIVVNK